MKKLILFLFLLLSINSYAQNDIYKTGGWYNGRYWEKLNETDKTFFVNGAGDGIAASIFIIPSDIISDKEALILQRELTAVGYTNKEIMKQISLFYSDVKNIKVAIAFAYIYSTYILNGKSEAFLEEFLKDLREETKTWE